MKRIFDISFSIILIIVFFFPIILIGVLVKITSPGPSIYWSPRIGKSNNIFYMPKFRTMRTGSPLIATHLLNNPDYWMTPIGSFLRKTSLDELPQIWSILRGEMSFVGPRPALVNQTDLINLRTQSGVHALIPGLTGWAQVNGRDQIDIPQKVFLDAEYLAKRSFGFDLRIIFLTILRVVSRKHVSH